MVPWIFAFLIAGVVAMVALVSLARQRAISGNGAVPPVNYQAIFFLGICILPTGVVFIAAAGPVGVWMLVFGVVEVTVGLSHRKEWKTA